MARKILAILAFNVYALFLISSFQENTAHLFDVSLIREMRQSGFNLNLREWGWGNHYIWRLFSSVIVTVLVSVLAGAIAKEGGARIAALANIPSVLVWGGMIYLLGFSGVEVEARTGFIVISIIAIPLTTYIAYLSGGFGEEVQRQEFLEHTVLGIKGYHWGWAIFPLYYYGLGIVFVGSKFVGFQLATWSDFSIFASFLSLLMLLPVVAWVYPLRIVHRVLMGSLFSNHNAVVRGLAVFCVLILGICVAMSVQIGIYLFLSKVLT